MRNTGCCRRGNSPCTLFDIPSVDIRELGNSARSRCNAVILWVSPIKRLHTGSVRSLGLLGLCEEFCRATEGYACLIY